MRLLATIVFTVALGARALYAGDLSLEQQLIIACYKRDAPRVARLLRRGANVNRRFGMQASERAEFRDRWTGGYPLLGADKWTPLLALASSPALPPPPAELGEIWKDAEASRRMQARIPRAAVEARHASQMTILLILLSHACKLDVDDGYGATALYMASDSENIPMARVLLEHGADPNTKTGIYIDGPGDTTPLHVACNSAEMMQLLLDHGADASARDSKGRTPADWVAWHRDRDFNLVRTDGGWRILRKVDANDGNRRESNKP